MKLEDVIMLLNNGYTKDEIESLAAGDDMTVTTDSSEPETTTTETGTTEQDTPEEDTNIEPAELVNDSNMAAIDELRAQIAEQTKEINSLRNQVINKNINTKTAPDTFGQANIYDLLADSIR